MLSHADLVAYLRGQHLVSVTGDHCQRVTHNEMALRPVFFYSVPCFVRFIVEDYRECSHVSKSAFSQLEAKTNTRPETLVAGCLLTLRGHGAPALCSFVGRGARAARIHGCKSAHIAFTACQLNPTPPHIPNRRRARVRVEPRFDLGKRLDIRILEHDVAEVRKVWNLVLVRHALFRDDGSIAVRK